MSGDLTQALRTANSGLFAGQQSLDVVARNIANVNTPGYTRKVVNLQQQTLAGRGAGVRFGELTRRVDQDLLEMLRREQGTLRARQTQKDALDTLQQLFGTTDSNTSLSHTLADLQGAVEALTLAPQNGLEQQSVVRAGRETASLLRHSSEQIQGLRRQADQQIGEALQEINGLLQTVAELNVDVVRNRSVGHGVADLEDQRDQALDRLSELIDVQVSGRASGDIVVFTAGGRTLVDSTAIELKHISAADAGAMMTHAEGDFDGIYAGARTDGNDITGDIRTGRLAGLVQLRDATLPALQSTLDELSVRLREGVNAVHNRGVAFPGSQEYAGTRLFRDPATQTIAFGGTTDTALVLFDAKGNEQARTTVRTELAAAGTPTPTVAELAAALNGAMGGDITADVSTGKLTIAISAAGKAKGLSLAFRDQAGSAYADARQDADIRFDADGAGGPGGSTPYAGFAAFFGLNDFFVDATGPAVHDSQVMTAGWAYGGRDTTLHLSNAGVGSAAVTLSAGDTLEAIAEKLRAVAGVAAAVIPDGSGFRLRVAAADGGPMTVVEATDPLSGQDDRPFLSAAGLGPSNADAAMTIDVRADLVARPALVARGVVQRDDSRAPSGQYVLSPGDDTAVRELAAAFAGLNDFAVAGRLSGTSATFAEYASSFIADAAALAADNHADSEFQNDLVDSLRQKSDSASGVNLDEEVSDLMLYEQAYTASARVVQVLQQMFEALDRALG